MALRLDRSVRDGLPYHMIMLDDVRRRIDQFDVLHFHIDLLPAPVVRDIADRTLTTLHGRLDLPDLAPFYGAFRELPLASISMVASAAVFARSYFFHQTTGSYCHTLQTINDLPPI